MTTFLDAPIALDPNGQALNPAIEYLAWCAWGDDLTNRGRFVAALVSAVFKQAGKHVPAPVPRMKREALAATVHKGLARIRLHVPAALLVQRRLASSTVLVPYRHPHQDIAPAKVADIAPDVWRDARPVLAMLLAYRSTWPGLRPISRPPRRSATTQDGCPMPSAGHWSWPFVSRLL